MRALVTGGTGLVGFNLTSYLYNEGHDLVITGHDAETKLSIFKGIYLQPSFIGLDWDRIGKVDVVFHQAAINDTTLLDKKEMFRANEEFSISDIDKDYPFENAFFILVSKKHIKCLSYPELKSGKNITPSSHNYLGNRKEFELDKEVIIDFCDFAVKFFSDV